MNLKYFNSSGTKLEKDTERCAVAVVPQPRIYGFTHGENQVIRILKFDVLEEIVLGS